MTVEFAVYIILFPIEAIHQRVPLGFNLDKVPSGHVNPFEYLVH